MIDTTKDNVVPLAKGITAVSLGIQPTESKFLMKQEQDTYCKLGTLQVACEGSEFYPDHREVLNRKSVEIEATQVVVLEPQRKLELYLSHHGPISGHPGQRRIYGTLQQT